MPQFHREPDPPRKHLVPELQPPCPKCGAPMWLVRIGVVDGGRDVRTFECQVCEHSESKMVEFKR